MTRTDVVASSRPRTAGIERTATGTRRSLRKRLAMPLAMLIAAALLMPTAALAAEEGLSTYNETKTTSSAAEPEKKAAPVKAAEPEQPKAATLPFTGLNLGNVVVIGFLLIGAGCSIVVVQRRQQHRANR